MKQTLLEMTQSILSDMDSDFVNDIAETVESDQVANTIRATYYYLINNVLDLPEHKEVLTFTALGDTSHPTYFLIPDTVKSIEYFRYNNATSDDPDVNYVDVEHLDPWDFQRKVNSRRESDTNVVAYSDFNAGKLLILNDVHPKYWTSFDDKYIVCDSYRSATDSTLQSSKVFAYGITEPTWTHSNTFTPDLDAHLFPLLYNEAKAQCFVDYKQVSNTKAEQRARKQITSIHNKLHRTEDNRFDRWPNYGR